MHKTDGSQYGPQVDLAAPGEDMVQACTGKPGICTGHGTSAASASAALIWSKSPSWTNNQVLRVMLNTAGGPASGEKRNNHIGYGIVRPRIALTNPGDPGPADEYPRPDLAAAATSPTPSEQQTKGHDNQTAAKAPGAESDGDGASWPVLAGLGTAVLLAGAVTTVVVRRRGAS